MYNIRTKYDNLIQHISIRFVWWCLNTGFLSQAKNYFSHRGYLWERTFRLLYIEGKKNILKIVLLFPNVSRHKSTLYIQNVQYIKKQYWIFLKTIKFRFMEYVHESGPCI